MNIQGVAGVGRVCGGNARTQRAQAPSTGESTGNLKAKETGIRQKAPGTKGVRGTG